MFGPHYLINRFVRYFFGPQVCHEKITKTLTAPFTQKVGTSELKTLTLSACGNPINWTLDSPHIDPLINWFLLLFLQFSFIFIHFFSFWRTRFLSTTLVLIFHSIYHISKFPNHFLVLWLFLFYIASSCCFVDTLSLLVCLSIL